MRAIEKRRHAKPVKIRQLCQPALADGKFADCVQERSVDTHREASKASAAPELRVLLAPARSAQGGHGLLGKARIHLILVRDRSW